eukprot:3814092-Prymnesium_polylepis.1
MPHLNSKPGRQSAVRASRSVMTSSGSGRTCKLTSKEASTSVPAVPAPSRLRYTPTRSAYESPEPNK